MIDARANQENDERPPYGSGHESCEQPPSQRWLPPAGYRAEEYAKDPSQEQYQQEADQFSRSLTVQTKPVRHPMQAISGTVVHDK